MFACDCIITTPDGSFRYHSGTILNLPAELSGSSKIAAYAALRNAGWHKIDFGYMALVRIGADGSRYCFPGALPSALDFKNKLNIPTQMSMKRVEEYVASIETLETSLTVSIREDLNLVVHDMRRLSSVIYHAAEEARLAIQTLPRDNGSVRLIDNIIAAQSMLRIRVDMIDYSGDPSQERAPADVQVFRKVDKVVRSFRPMAERSSVQITLKGSSYSTSWGPDVLEIVPYILIDNAVKYSPHNGHIDVEVSESPDSISFHVNSIGPNIKPHEIQRIFERGYRGEATRDRGDSGSGLGLFLCKRIVDSFGGTIEVAVGQREIMTGKGNCRDIGFAVCLPKSRSIT
jgi:signal transduction histidine kinase